MWSAEWWATATRSDADHTNDIAVANMSLDGVGSDDGNCGRTNSDPIHLAICNSTAAGVTYVAAAGNVAVDFQGLIPAAYDEVLTVTAMLDHDGKPGGVGAGPADGSCGQPPDDRYARFSDFATLPADQAHTLAAPGVCIVSTAAPGSQLFPGVDLYGSLSGTSMAAPHVAGAAALCAATGACQGLTAAQIVQKLRGDAERYNTTKGKDYGFLGDQLRPLSGSYYGYLIRAALY